MSFNRTNYDICSVEQSLEQSMKPGQYRLNPPTKSVDLLITVLRGGAKEVNELENWINQRN